MYRLALVLSILLTAHIAMAAPPTQQMILVLSSDWDSIRAELRLFEKKVDGPWQQRSDPIPVVLGKKGLGWGRGLHGNGVPPGLANGSGDPVKREGDGRAPAGIFPLGTAFGYSPTPLNSAYPYLYASPTVRCVDDVASPFYNRLVDDSAIAHAWNSDEAMRRNDALYKWGINVEHNVQPIVPGAGSCIFLHIWRDGETGTAGCTAMEEKNITSLVQWLDKAKQPVLVQLPRSVYRKVKDQWQLP